MTVRRLREIIDSLTDPEATVLVRVYDPTSDRYHIRDAVEADLVVPSLERTGAGVHHSRPLVIRTE